MTGGGAERVMSVLTNEFVRREHQVYLATNCDQPFAYSLHPAIQCISLYPRAYGQKSRLFRPFYLLKSIRSIAVNVHPDVIVSFMYDMTSYVLPAVWGLSIPVVASEHTTYDREMSLSDKIKRFYINDWAARVTILTWHDYHFLGKRLPGKVVLPNPLTFDIHLGLKEKRRNILAIGRLDGWYVKGFDNLIKIWAGIAHFYPDWKLEFVGEGSEQSRGYLTKLVKQYNIEESVRFLNFRKDIDKLMQESSVFVLSSRNEGFPMCLIEAMSQGMACVSFNCISGPDEIITPDVSGLLVPDQDLVEMRKALCRVIEGTEIREELSQNAIHEVERFSKEKIVSLWENLFKEVTCKK